MDLSGLPAAIFELLKEPIRKCMHGTVSLIYTQILDASIEDFLLDYESKTLHFETYKRTTIFSDEFILSLLEKVLGHGWHLVH